MSEHVTHWSLDDEPPESHPGAMWDCPECGHGCKRTEHAEAAQIVRDLVAANLPDTTIGTICLFCDKEEHQLHEPRCPLGRAIAWARKDALT